MGHYLKHLSFNKSSLNLNERPNTCLIDYSNVVAPILAGMTFLLMRLLREIKVQMSWAFLPLLFMELQYSGMRA